MPEYSLLLVDDELDFLEVLSEFLKDEGYSVFSASTGEEALTLLESRHIDMVLSDIKMPGIKGFELLRECTKRFPHIKTALITAYDVRDYMNLAKNFNIGNIITKTTPFNFDEIRLLIHNIVTGDVFGLDHYINGPCSTKMLASSRGVETTIHAVIDQIPQAFRRKLRQAFGEVVINAIYYGAKNERGDKKDEWDLDVNLLPNEEIQISWGFDDQKAGIAIVDQKGRLTKRDVLYWLERNTTKDENGISLGLLDEHGKGLFISRETVDRFIINTKRNEKTEVIMLNYRQGLYDGHRPLWIQEL